MVELLIGNSALGTTNIIMSGQHFQQKNSLLTSTGNTHRVISVNISIASFTPALPLCDNVSRNRLIKYATEAETE